MMHETEAGVDGVGGVIVRFDVQHSGSEALVSEPVETGSGQRKTETLTMVGRMYGDGVDLAKRRVLVDLGPAKPNQVGSVVE